MAVKIEIYGNNPVFPDSSKKLKSQFCERNGEVGSKIPHFLANSPNSDVKSISNAIGLKTSRTNYYLKLLLDAGKIESTEGWRKTYRIKNK